MSAKLQRVGASLEPGMAVALAPCAFLVAADGGLLRRRVHAGFRLARARDFLCSLARGVALLQNKSTLLLLADRITLLPRFLLVFALLCKVKCLKAFDDRLRLLRLSATFSLPSAFRRFLVRCSQSFKLAIYLRGFFRFSSTDGQRTFREFE